MKEKLQQWSGYAPGLIFIALGLLIVAFPMLLVVFASAFLILMGIFMISVAHKVNTLEKEVWSLFEEEPFEFEKVHKRWKMDIF